MKKLLFAFVAIVLCTAGYNSFGADLKNVVGSWKIEVPDAPAEFVNSTMVVSEKAGKIEVKMVLPDGAAIEGENPKLEGNILKFKMNIEGNEIPFTGKLEGENLTGTVESPDGTISVKGTKVAITGVWKYNAPDAPYEYSSGKIAFNEINGKPSGKIILSNGYEVPVANLKLNKTGFSFTVDVENETVTVSGELINGKVKGKAETSQGTLSIEAER